MKKRLRILKIATSLLVGGYVAQLGGCISMGINTALASTPFGTLFTNAGLPGVCGIPNFILVDAQGIPQGGVMNVEDDLVFGCPITTVVEAGDQGGGDDGDGGDGGNGGNGG